MQSNRKRMQVVVNSSLGAPFALGENFGEQQTKSLVATPKFSPNTKLPPQILEFDLKTDSANSQNLKKIIAHKVRTLIKFLLLFAFAKRRVPLNFINSNSPNNANSQNLNKNSPRVSANLESCPLRGAKNRIQASSSASADFLLEAEKRGSPPKSEKAAAFWRVGGAGRGVQPFLREKTSELSRESGVRVAESKKISRLPRRFYESARNDDSFLDSANQRKPAESTLDSAIFALLKQ